MKNYKVKYHAGTYSGTREVRAEDGDEAIRKVRDQIRSQMSLSMYSDSYRIVDNEEECEDED